MNLREQTTLLLEEENVLRQGGGEKGKDRQRRLGRLTARERLKELLDDPLSFWELGLWAGYGMYTEWGKFPAAGVIAGVGAVEGRLCMIIANDATVKAGALVPQSVKKILRAQRIAYSCRLPLLYLVDSAGVFLPLQDEIFPDEDDFGRIFRNNAVLSASGIPQYAAVMGNCIAGGAYLPVLCDQLLMTEGSGLYLAGPALVKAAIGQVVDPEELGGAKMHAEISGTVDYHEPDDQSCLKRLRQLVGLLQEEPKWPLEPSDDKIYAIADGEYDTRMLLEGIVDPETWIEYKSSYGPTLVTGFARLGGRAVGIVANQHCRTETARGEVEMGGVIYADSADKAARFVMECNQTNVPLLFFQDVVGFMVGREAEESGIIRSGAKLVSAIANSVVPKITVILGNSFGAGNYALCGKAYDPDFIVAWPTARLAVMGAEQAASIFAQIGKGDQCQAVRETFENQVDIRYGAARGWVDALVTPQETRSTLMRLLHLASRAERKKSFHTGVLQV